MKNKWLSQQIHKKQNILKAKNKEARHFNQRFNDKYQNIKSTKRLQNDYSIKKLLYDHKYYDYWDTSCFGKKKNIDQSNIYLYSYDTVDRIAENNYFYKPDMMELLDNNEIMMLLINGFAECELPPDVEEMIRKYSWMIWEYNMQCITATHIFIESIDKYINYEKNICPFSKNIDLDILKYIYVRGGSIRDCFLLREINDIDIIINIHSLNKQYFKHLIKYHSSKEGQRCSNCIFWRHYLNKFKRTHYLRNQSKTYGLSTNNVKINKILGFEEYIISSDYVLNSKFIIKILQETLREYVNIKSVYNDQHWIVNMRNITHKNVYIDNVNFDIVDNTGNSYGRFQIFKYYRYLTGINNKNKINEVVSDINCYQNHLIECNKIVKRREGCIKLCKYIKCSNLFDINIPIYPFSFNECVIFNDFTINCIHIDFRNILRSQYNQFIDYNFENKIISIYNRNDINKYNEMALNDMNNKILTCPNIEIINVATIDFYFWRFIKLTQKFINKIINGIWIIDEEYLKRIEKLCHNVLKRCCHFIHKLIEWGIQNKIDYINRFKVFQYIGFDKYFKAKLIANNRFSKKLRKEIGEISHLQRKEALLECFCVFKYPKFKWIKL